MDSNHAEKADEALRLALSRANEGDSLCAILMLILPEMPEPPLPKAFSTRSEWRQALIARNEAWVALVTCATAQLLSEVPSERDARCVERRSTHGPEPMRVPRRDRPPLQPARPARS